MFESESGDGRIGILCILKGTHSATNMCYGVAEMVQAIAVSASEQAAWLFACISTAKSLTFDLGIQSPTHMTCFTEITDAALQELAEELLGCRLKRE